MSIQTEETTASVIEHTKYLARCAERLLASAEDALRALNQANSLEDGEEFLRRLVTAVKAASQACGEHRSELQSAIHDFRKCAANMKPVQVPTREQFEEVKDAVPGMGQAGEPYLKPTGSIDIETAWDEGYNAAVSGNGDPPPPVTPETPWFQILYARGWESGKAQLRAAENYQNVRTPFEGASLESSPARNCTEPNDVFHR